MIDTFGTGKVDDLVITDYVVGRIDTRPAAIIERFGLRRPIYGDVAAYGHMGREDVDAPWEKIDFADDIKATFNY